MKNTMNDFLRRMDGKIFQWEWERIEYILGCLAVAKAEGLPTIKWWEERLKGFCNVQTMDEYSTRT